ncbi:MAG: TetR/AcrR family transcriptional regulator [Myxococcota bacterium]
MRTRIRRGVFDSQGVKLGPPGRTHRSDPPVEHAHQAFPHPRSRAQGHPPRGRRRRVAAHGYDGASANRIVERAHTSKGSLYYYFEDKADLYGTVIREALTRFMAHCGDLPPVRDPASYWDAIRAFSRGALAYYRGDPHIAGLVRSLATGGGLSVVSVAEVRATYHAWFAALVEAGQALGAVRTDLPVSLQIAVATAVSEAFDVWLVDNLATLDEADLDRLSHTITDLYRRMAAP